MPFVLSLTALDCGAASLAMVLGYHGRKTSLEEVRDVLDVRQGTSADQILRAARAFGLVGYGVKAEVDQLDCLEPGAILHWDFNHFVVFEKLVGSRVRFLDPTAGQRELPLEEFGKSFTGVALVLEPGPDFLQRKARASQFRRYLVEVLRDHGLWVRILITSALLQVFSLALPFVTGAVVETIIPRADRSMAVLSAMGAGIILVATFLAILVRGLMLLYWRMRLDGRLSPGVFAHLLSLPLEYFEQRLASHVGLRLAAAAALRDGMTAGLLSGLLDGVMVVSYGALVFWISPLMGLVVAFLALAQAGVLVLTWRAQRLRAAEELAAGEEVTAATYDILLSIETVKGQGLEGRVFQQWLRYFLAAQNTHVHRNQLGAWVDAVSGALRLGSPLIILLLGTYQVMAGGMGLATMLALNAVAAGLFLPIANLVQTAQQLNSLARHVERVDDVFVGQPEPRGPAVADRRLRGQLTVENVCYRFGRSAPLAIEDVSFQVEPGELVAIVGRSGSGKSTLAKVIGGLYPPASGRVLYDGLGLGELGLSCLRGQMGYVAQRPGFMGQSIRLNISNFDGLVPLERVHAAARLAGIHEEILQMPMGYETTLLNDAATVSGGQRQRIALARALISEPTLLILDEATSALDAELENQVFATLREVGRTMLVVAHRFSTIRRADRIVVLDGGHVAAVGTHETLLEQSAVYRTLASAQAET